MTTSLEGRPVPGELSRAHVLDAAGRPRHLGSAWEEGPCLISFLRHFGCTGCSEHVSELSPRLLELYELGVRAVFVGNGEPRFIEAFATRHALEDKHVEVLTDPTLAAFRAAGLLRSAWATLGPRALAEKVRGLTRGFGWGGMKGDQLQQGGSIVVDAAGKIALYHRSESLGGHARPTDIIDAALRIAAARTRSGVHV